jgi:hypothetical protein
MIIYVIKQSMKLQNITLRENFLKFTYNIWFVLIRDFIAIYILN